MHRSSAFLAAILAAQGAAYPDGHPGRRRRTVLPTSRRTPVVQKAAPSSPWKGHGRERYAFERECCLFCGAKEGVECRVVDGDPGPWLPEEAAFVEGSPVRLHAARFKRMGQR